VVHGVPFQVVMPSKSMPSWIVGGWTMGGVPWPVSILIAWVCIGRVMIRRVSKTSITSINGVVFMSATTSPGLEETVAAMVHPPWMAHEQAARGMWRNWKGNMECVRR
jgi:hypothetical protein